MLWSVNSGEPVPETKQVIFGQGQLRPPRGRVLVNAQRGVVLIASNLPPAPYGKIYELWVIPKQGVPRPAGLFQSNPQGNALYLRGGALDMTTTSAIAVTLEPASGSNAPTTTPVVVAPVVGL
jgi:anti-sigma-K factor RskA